MGVKENKMNALVTGGGGFVGSALVKELLKLGHKITSFSRNDHPALRDQGVVARRGDISDPVSVSDACEGIDIVFHTAAKAGFWGPYKEYFDTNVRGTDNIIAACRRHKIKWLVFTSSASVVFNGHEIKGGDESLPYPKTPISFYTGTKALAEKSVLEANSPSLRTIAIRPHIIIGPGDNHLIPRLLERSEKGNLIRIGDGRNLVDLSFIDNVVYAHICAAHALMNKPDASGKAYFISNGEPVLLWDVINLILEEAGMKPVRASIPEKPAYLLSLISEMICRLIKSGKEPLLTRFVVHELSKSHWFRIDSARKNLDFNPVISNQEGIRRLIASLRPQ